MHTVAGFEDLGFDATQKFKVQIRIRGMHRAQSEDAETPSDWSTPGTLSTSCPTAEQHRAKFTEGDLDSLATALVRDHGKFKLRFNLDDKHTNDDEEHMRRLVLVRTTATVQDESASSGCEVFLFLPSDDKSHVEARYSCGGVGFREEKVHESHKDSTLINRWILDKHGFLQLVIKSASTSSIVDYRVCVLDRRVVTLPWHGAMGRVVVELPARTGPGPWPWILNELSVYGLVNGREQLLVPCRTIVSCGHDRQQTVTWFDPLSSAHGGHFGLKAYPTGAFQLPHPFCYIVS